MTAAFSKAVVPVCAAGALAAMPLIAHSAWLSVETPNVRVLTEFSQRDTDKIIQRIWLHRYMIGLHFNSWRRFSSDTPPLVVVLRGDNWRKYIGGKDRVGVTVETSSGQLILVDGDEWDRRASTVLHEMTHYYLPGKCATAPIALLSNAEAPAILVGIPNNRKQTDSNSFERSARRVAGRLPGVTLALRHRHAPPANPGRRRPKRLTIECARARQSVKSSART